MALNRTKGGSSWIKPKELMNDLAILVEPTDFKADVDRTYKGQTSKKDVGTADFTVFGTTESLEKGVPTQILKGHQTDAKALADELKQQMGQQFVARIKLVPMGGGEGYVFRSSANEISDEVFGQVEAYLEKRTAEVQANLDAAPGFDD